jgi:hypothetical protein
MDGVVVSQNEGSRGIRFPATSNGAAVTQERTVFKTRYTIKVYHQQIATPSGY